MLPFVPRQLCHHLSHGSCVTICLAAIVLPFAPRQLCYHLSHGSCVTICPTAVCAQVTSWEQQARILRMEHLRPPEVVGGGLDHDACVHLLELQDQIFLDEDLLLKLNRENKSFFDDYRRESAIRIAKWKRSLGNHQPSPEFAEWRRRRATGFPYSEAEMGECRARLSSFPSPSRGDHSSPYSWRAPVTQQSHNALALEDQPNRRCHVR